MGGDKLPTFDPTLMLQSVDYAERVLAGSFNVAKLNPKSVGTVFELTYFGAGRDPFLKSSHVAAVTDSQLFLISDEAGTVRTRLLDTDRRKTNVLLYSGEDISLMLDATEGNVAGYLRRNQKPGIITSGTLNYVRGNFTKLR